MADLFDFFSDDKPQNNTNEGNQNTSSTTQSNQEGGTLQLHKEELDITKNNVNAGEVVLSKDVVEEQKTVDVPVMHEEVVIKRTPLNNQQSNASISSDETIRIPVNQEQVQVNKHTVATEEISASKHQVEETHQVNETLKHEEAQVNTTGSVHIASHDASSSGTNS